MNSGIPSRGLRSAADLAVDKPHGTRIRYMGGCKCPACKRANSQYETDRARARKAGLSNGIVDAAPARAHIRKLRRLGLGRRSIAEACDVRPNCILEVARGTKRRIRGNTLRAILSVTPAAAANRVLVDARPTWRLLEELLEEGFSEARLCKELGYVQPRLQIGRDKCTVRNAYEVKTLHARLTT